MSLSEEDIKILTLEKKKRENDAIYSPLPNGELREKLWHKSWDLHRKISTMIYDYDGMYRKDKRHLLIGSSLNIDLLEGNK